MNYHIKCSKCPPLADTHICTQSCQWLSPVTQTKLTKVHFNTRKLVLASVKLLLKLQHFPQT